MIKTGDVGRYFLVMFLYEERAGVSEFQYFEQFLGV